MSFVHLHTHSEYSLLESPCRIEDLIARCKKEEMSALAITDSGNMFGTVEFYTQAKKHGIKPIIGLEAYIAPHGRHKKQAEFRKTRRIVLLAQNYKGYQNLCKISSIGYQEGFYYVPRIDDEVLKMYSENLIVLSGGINGDIARVFFEEGEAECEQRIKWYKDVYQDRFYLEVNLNLSECRSLNPFLKEMGKKHNISLVAANNTHYLNQDDEISQEVLICIGSNKTLTDKTRFRLGSDQFYFKSEAEMKNLFHDMPEAVETASQIADRCNLEFRLKDEAGNPVYHLPSFEKDKDPKSELRQLVMKGLKSKNIPSKDLGNYEARIDKELEIINNMEFSGYFLIVQDFVSWCKKNAVPVGPGRGSGAGSLVAYCLGITALDPIPLGLIFERFLNPERISMPDFDIDFCQENRHKVLAYVSKKYSPESVSHIMTYGRLQARAALRDVGRVMGLAYDDVDKVAKLIPDILKITLQESLEKEPRLKTMIAEDPQIKRLFELAMKIEGVVRHASIHAAGIIIADGNIVSHAPLYKGPEGENVIQYDMKSAEALGLIKFDFLGLKTLTHIHEALKLIKENRKKHLKVEDIDVSDKGIYELLSKGNTLGVFQFEGSGVTDVIKQIQPKNFQEIMAINALYRPGPMEKIPEYIERRNNPKKISYIFDELEEILKETLGVIVYQEQVQFIASRIANYSLGEADILRKAMGKKVASEMKKQKTRFLQGALENKYNTKKSEILFDTMAEFAKYGFNKSHAAAYCVLSAQTAYLKTYYPYEFYAALFSTEMKDIDKLSRYIKDAKKNKVEIKPPHINHSDYRFTVKKDSLFFSIGAIKGVGQSAVEAVLKAREEGEFKSLEDFFERVDLRRVNKKTIESLIKAGAFDGMGYHRRQLMEHFPSFVESAERKRAEKEAGQTSLFSLDESFEKETKVNVPEERKWSKFQELIYEKQVLGLYLTDHPLKICKKFVEKQGWGQLSQDNWPEKKNTEVQVVGVVDQMRDFFTKKGQRMAFVRLEMLDEFIELVVFPECFSTYEFLLKGNDPLIVYGNTDSEKGKLIATKIESMNEKISEIRKVVFNVTQESESENNKKRLEILSELFKMHQGSIPLSLNVDLGGSKKVKLKIEEPQGLVLSMELFDGFYKIMGESSHVDIL